MFILLINIKVYEGIAKVLKSFEILLQNSIKNTGQIMNENMQMGFS